MEILYTTSYVYNRHSDELGMHGGMEAGIVGALLGSAVDALVVDNVKKAVPGGAHGSQDTVVAHGDLLPAGWFAAGQTLQKTVWLTLPAEAPPDAHGAITQIQWKARAVIELPYARDAHAEQEFAVRAPAPATPIEPATLKINECEIAVKLPGYMYRPGDAISGTVEITPHLAFGVSAVRVELVCHEDVSVDLGNAADTVVSQVVAAQDPQYLPGSSRQYPFTLDIPPDSCPSLITSLTSVQWQLRVVLSRAMQHDDQLAQPICVYRSPLTSPGP
ncbi:MAG TPA: hypothetical protein VFB58_09590 [Chloroflexota bacterium]|nr:hypothetical protein [Chloroflexota bacterium]